jgi:hypothetical protein
MVYSFNWNTQPTEKAAEAVATQYIKAKYGTNLADFAKMIIKEQSPPEAISSIGTHHFTSEGVVAT